MYESIDILEQTNSVIGVLEDRLSKYTLSGVTGVVILYCYFAADYLANPIIFLFGKLYLPWTYKGPMKALLWHDLIQTQ